MQLDSALPPAPQFILHPFRREPQTLAKVGDRQKSRLSTGSRMSYGMTPLGSSLPSSFISENGSFVIEKSFASSHGDKSVAHYSRSQSQRYPRRVDPLSQGCAVLDESQESSCLRRARNFLPRPWLLLATRRTRSFDGVGFGAMLSSSEFSRPPLLDDGGIKMIIGNRYHGARDSIGTREIPSAQVCEMSRLPSMARRL